MKSRLIVIPTILFMVLITVGLVYRTLSKQEEISQPEETIQPEEIIQPDEISQVEEDLGATFGLRQTSPWTLISSVSAASTGGSPNTTTTAGINTTGADLLVAFVGSYVPGTFPTFSDSKGNTWTQLGTSAETYSEATIFYSIPSSVGTSHTFTSAGTNAYPNIVVMAWKGVNKQNPFITENGNTTGGGSNNLLTGSVTPTTARALVIAGVEYGEANSVTNNAGLTELVDTPWSAGNNFHFALIYETQSTSTIRNPQWTSSGGGAGNVNGATRIAVFRPAGEARFNVTRDDVVTDGLVGHWTMDGNDLLRNVRDNSGRGNNGVLSGVVSTTTDIGRVGQAIKFDGVNDFIDIADNAALRPGTGAWTLSFWMKISTASQIAPLVTKREASGNFVQLAMWIGNTDASCGLTAGTQIVFVQNSAAQTTCGESVASYNDNTWHHVVLTRASSGQFARLFVDGTQISTTTPYTFGTGVANVDTTVSWKIGTDTSGTNFSSGSMDDVRIYNREITNAEVTTLYNQGNSARVNVSRTDILTDGLVAHYTFDGKHLTPNVKDVSGRGNNGYLVTVTSTTTAIGKLGQALRFNGVSNAGVDVPHSSSIAVAGPGITMATWLYLDSAPTSETDWMGKWDLPNNIRSYAMGSYYQSPFPAVLCLMSKDSGTTNWHIQRSTNSILTAGWQHVACVYDGTSWTIYYNGVSQAVSNDLGSAQSSIYTGGSEELHIGYLPGTTAINGAIDDMRIYNRALTASEVLQLYKLGL